MEILVDSREKKPLIKGHVKKLVVGDYTTMDLEGIVHIERKSPEDLYATITKGHRRFKKQIMRAKELGIKMPVLVESNKKVFLSKKWDRSGKLKVSTTTLSRILRTMKITHGLTFIWCENRQDAKNKLIELLWKYHCLKTAKRYHH